MKERLEGEKDTLGLYLTGHPIDEYENELKHLVSSRISEVKPDKNKQTIAGLAVAFRVMKTKRGDNMAFVTLDDRSGRMEVAVFSDTYNEYRESLVKDAMLVIEGEISNDDYSGGLKMRADKVRDLNEVRESKIRAIKLVWNKEAMQSDQVGRLQATLERFNNGQQHCPVVVSYDNGANKAEWTLGQRFQVQPCDALLEELRIEYGHDQVEIHFG